MSTREQIYQALFQLVSSATFVTPNSGPTSFKVAQRRYKKPDSVLKTDMPALFQVQRTEKLHGVKIDHGLPIKRNLFVELHILVHSTSSEFPSSVMNPILDAVDNALAPPQGQKQTLGGLVEWVYVDSAAIRHYEHTNGNQMVSVVPINILRFY